MPNLLHILLRILAGIAGALLLYVAFFLYEDEEARIQNRLEQIWRKIDALQSIAMSKEVAFLQEGTRTTSAILDQLLGHKLVSWQSIAVSMAFSLASLFFVLVCGGPSTLTRWQFGMVSNGILLVFLGSVPALAATDRSLTRSRTYFVGLMSWVTLIIASTAYGATVSAFNRVDAECLECVVLNAGFYELAVLCGVIVDMFFIVFFRWTLRKIGRFSSLAVLVLMLMAVGSIAALLVIPAVPLFANSLVRTGGKALLFLRWVSATNLVDALCLLLLVAVMMLLLVHRLLWPLIKRPIYAANRKQLIKNTKLLGAMGAMLLLYAFPNNPLVKWITHFLPNLKGG